ncbi:MAG: hypothetical protein Q9M43_11495 [Sulfurimonas sp.]|nr:hypothetical protein [Sulfurimonas sp.]
MKKLILGLLLFCSSLLAEMNWAEYDEAFVQAKAEKKIVMVMLSRSTCGVCNYMKKRSIYRGNSH